ncbi:VWA domain-containing protein [uncultured Corynebacterium sp.]|uniref:VWA domain-containing protein n=1 Tax=uncultured Corynebacterium sp. TaxID=159447 RepID=UPI0025FBDEF4|nr:VWA domain-containing protein [uncultured Corynebacterium sp.]
MSFRQTLKMSLTASAAAALAVVAAPFVAAPASAADEEGKKIPPTMLVLDGSYSMVEKDVDGRARIDVAKEAANKVLTKIGDATDVGLLTYGTKVSNGPDDKVEGCKDITLLSGPVSGKVDDLKDKVDEVTPKGFTPIGEALRAAAEALPDSGDRTIVLVSDGADTCAPPPVCEVARELDRNGVDLVINTVGLLVDRAAREELECIAEATGGSYADAKDAEQLIQGVEEAATGEKVGGGSGSGAGQDNGSGNGSGSSSGGSDAAGEIIGGTSADSATEVTADTTTFRTTITANGSRPSGGKSAVSPMQGVVWEQLWWIPVTDGERITVGINSLPTDDGVGKRAGLDDLGANLLLDGNVSNHQGDSDPCIGSGHSQFQDVWKFSQTKKPGPVGIGNAGLVTKALTGECSAGRLLLAVTLNDIADESEGIEDTPIEISVTRFGQVDLSAQPPAAATDREFQLADTLVIPDNIVDVTPGIWFDDAGELPADGSGAAELEIMPGETQFFKVRAGYGQTLKATVSGGTQTSERVDPYGSAGLDLRAFNPARLQVADVWASGGSARYLWYPENIDVNNMFLGDQAYGFRSGVAGPGGKFSTVWLGGEQYFRVTYYDYEGKATAPYTYRIAALVEGDETDGPQFSSIVGPGEFAPEGAGDGNGTTNQASSGSSGGINGLGVATVVFAALALVFAAAAILVRRAGGIAGAGGAGDTGAPGVTVQGPSYHFNGNDGWGR